LNLSLNMLYLIYRDSSVASDRREGRLMSRLVLPEYRLGTVDVLRFVADPQPSFSSPSSDRPNVAVVLLSDDVDQAGHFGEFLIELKKVCEAAPN